MRRVLRWSPLAYFSPCDLCFSFADGVSRAALPVCRLKSAREPEWRPEGGAMPKSAVVLSICSVDRPPNRRSHDQAS
eukprot:scaffold130343_cov26-Tisochrysis_lutea.AAC.1